MNMVAKVQFTAAAQLVAEEDLIVLLVVAIGDVVAKGAALPVRTHSARLIMEERITLVSCILRVITRRLVH
jgi:predicted deacylase